MAEEQNEQAVIVPEAEEEVKDRGLSDFLGKKEEDEEKKPKVEDDILVASVEKIHIEEGEKVEGEKKLGILDKLHRSSSSSSSSSDEEEVEGEGGIKEKIKRKKKGLKEMIEQKLHGGQEKGDEAKEKGPAPPVEEDTMVVVGSVKVEETAPAPHEEEKKGFLDKIKEKLPSHHKKPAEEAGAAAPSPPAPAPGKEEEGHEGKEKKGFLGKIMEKLPGYHKNGGEESEKSSPASL